MSKEMMDELIGYAQNAVATELTYTDIASTIKAEMTKTFTGVWHVVVGSNFGSSFTHQEKNSAYFYIGQTGIVCFRTV